MADQTKLQGSTAVHEEPVFSSDQVYNKWKDIEKRGKLLFRKGLKKVKKVVEKTTEIEEGETEGREEEAENAGEENEEGGSYGHYEDNKPTTEEEHVHDEL